MNEISIITPVYNEQDNIAPFVNKIEEVMKRINQSYELIFILDPGTDDTENIILETIKKNKNIKLIVTSRKFGQPAAMLAGLNNAIGENIVFIDVDLQDPPELIEKMYLYIKEGYDAVLAKRTKKKGENFIRKKIAETGYNLINKLSETKIPKNVGEYRMISRNVANEIIKMNDSEFFLRGMVSYVGFNQKIIEFDRQDRKLGITKYNKYTGSLNIGLNGIFSYSYKPLHLIMIISTISFLLSTVIFFGYLVLTFFNFFVFKYQFFIINLILLVSSLIFFSIGIISEYFSRLIPAVKKRQAYIIKKKINFDK